MIAFKLALWVYHFVVLVVTWCYTVYTNENVTFRTVEFALRYKLRNVIHFWDLMMKCSNVNKCNCTQKNLKIALFFLRKLYSTLWSGRKSVRIIFLFPKYNQHFLSMHYFFSAWNKYLTANLQIKHTFLMKDCVIIWIAN